MQRYFLRRSSTRALAVFDSPPLARAIAQDRGVLHFDFEIEGIEVIAPVNDDAEIRARFRELHQRRLDLAGEDDQAANRDGVVAASLDGGDLGMRAATGAALLPHTRERS